MSQSAKPPPTQTAGREIERLVAALHHQIDETEPVTQTLRHITQELERRTLAERRCAELLESEQRARAMARESQAANEAKDRLLAVLGRELRTPLQPVLGAASALLRDPRLPQELLHDVWVIQRNAQLEARLIDDLIDLTHIARGTFVLERRPVNIEPVIARALDLCELDVMARHQRVALRLDARRHWVDADPARLQKVLWNLIKNAVWCSPVGSRIVVETGNAPAEVGGHQLVVRVMDNGIGIEPGELSRIFEPPKQDGEGMTESPPADGCDRGGRAGLGLTICKLIVERHGGTLSAQSDGPGRGATFTIALPAVDAPADLSSPAPATAMATAPAAAEGDAPATAPDQPRLRILLVEDDPDANYVMGKLLASAGHVVTSAHDCASALALALAAEAAYDVIVCDLGLPDGSGLDVMSRLKPLGARGIALTGYGSAGDAATSRAAGFDLHLTKPVTLEQLAAAMAKLF